MSGWLLPMLALCTWAGLLCSDLVPVWVRPWMGFAIGAAALGAAWLGAPDRTETDALAGAGVAEPPPSAVEAVESPRLEVRMGAAAAAVPVFVVIGALALGAAWGGIAAGRVSGAISSGLTDERVIVVGTLRTDPSLGGYGWSATLDVDRIWWGDSSVATRESVWLSGDGEPPGAVRGDRVRVEGRFGIPDDDFAGFLRHRGIATELGADSFARLGPATQPLIRATQAVRIGIAGSIERMFPPREAGLLLGLILGDDSGLDASTERDFRATGLGHLLVVSGGNVAMVLIPFVALATWVGLGRWPRFLIALVVVVFFVVLTGAEPSVMRAGVMACLALVGVLIGRPRATGTLLAGAVFVLLVVDPWLAWSVGFQLSAAATAGMVLLATPIAERLARALPRPVALAAAATLSAQAGVAPLLLYYFRDIPGVALLANVVAYPAVSPALLMGAGAALVGGLWEPAGRLLAGLALLPLRYLEAVADTLAQAPVAHVTTAGGPVVLMVGGGLLVSAGIVLRRVWRPPRWMVAATIAAAPALVWSSALGSGAPDGLTVRFFDVGQGDAALVTSPGGAAILIDGGPDDEEVAVELAALGVKRLDVVVASHPHADHIVGLPTVLTRFPVGLVLEPGCPDDSALYDELEAAIGEEGVDVRRPRAGDVVQVGDVRLEVLSPHECWTGTESDTNNDALVILASIGTDTVLFATEPEEPAQEWLLEEGVALEADVLKVPHHGAATSIPEFFQAVSADVAVVSVGENDYGHPVPTTLEAVAATGATVWRTDEHGTVTVTFVGGRTTVTADR